MSPSGPAPVLTLGDVARHFAVELWQVRRLYERGQLPPAHRCGRYRVALPGDLPAIERALRQCGYLKPAGAAS
jgi:hypothetical protein